MNDKGYEEMVAKAIRCQRSGQWGLDRELFCQGEVDEVSLLFSTADQLDAFLLWAKRQGVDHFNSVPEDRMVRRDEDEFEAFDVRFEFLRLPNRPAWRIEAMCVLAGTAPLHSQHLERYGEGCVVHASWKVRDAHHYKQLKTALGYSLGSMGSAVPFHAEYRNSYGMFSYWGTGRPFYYKPRVNLRDSGESRTPST